MKERITKEELNKLTKEQKDFLLECWKPMDGNIVTEGEKEYILYKEKVLPMESGSEDSFIKEKFLPLLSMGELYYILENEFGQSSIEYGTSKNDKKFGEREQLLLNENIIEQLWKLFNEYSSYHISVEKMSEMVECLDKENNPL